MKTKLLLTLLILCNLVTVVSAQLSIYSSASYGYFQNPLYNYEKLPDQLKQTYTELDYTKNYDMSKLNLRYISGLVLFNRFEDRNYYVHNLSGKYNLKFSGTDSEIFSETKEEAFDDSTDRYLDLMLTVGGRHDKSFYKDFDNFGTDFLTSYRLMLNENYFLRLTNELGYRNYNNINVLSNITNLLTLQVGNKFNKSFNYGLNISGGFKYYTQSIYDTSKFEIERSFTVKTTGKGKTGAKINVPSDKEILISPHSNGTAQFVADFFLRTNWDTNSLQINFLYRHNPNTLVRYLAQYANTTFLTEDIYNDFYSYEGLEAKFRLIQTIFYNIYLRLDLSVKQKNFGAPALNLTGVETSHQRKDLRTFTELYISKYFNLSENLGLGIALSSGFTRNQSNDDYNDFSSYYISFSIGFGFYMEM